MSGKLAIILGFAGAGVLISLLVVLLRPVSPVLAEIGMRDKMVQEVRQLLRQRQGLIIVCGPNAAGKTPTIDAALNDISGTRKIVTIGYNTERPLPNITHIEVDARQGQAVAAALRTARAHDADVVVLSEIRDDETAQLACRAAADRLVLTTLDAPDSVSGLFRVLDLAVDADSVTAVLSQRQIRRLCDQCKEPYKPKPEYLQKANLQALVPLEKIDVLYRPPTDPQVRCRHCGGTGYRGTTGIFELLVTTDTMRGLLDEEDPSMIRIKEEARMNGMWYLQEDGLLQVIRGVTGVSELVRVLTE